MNSRNTAEQKAGLPASNMPADSMVWLSDPVPCSSSNVSAALNTAASLAHGMGAKWLFVALDEGQSVRVLQPDAAISRQQLLKHVSTSTSAVQFCLVEGSSAETQEAQVRNDATTCSIPFTHPSVLPHAQRCILRHPNSSAQVNDGIEPHAHDLAQY
jgi:hypothetical protein